MCMQHHYDRNRKAVQQGLDQRKEQRQEAAQDAAERDLRVIINTNAKTHRTEMERAQAARERQAVQKVEQAMREHEQTVARIRSAKEKKVREAREFRVDMNFSLLILGSLLIAAVLTRLFAIDVVPVWVAVPLVIFLMAFSWIAFVEYVKPGQKRKEGKA